MREAWSSPTRTAARPGMMPRSARARTRSATSRRICPAIARPSRILAVTLRMLPAARTGHQARGTRGAASDVVVERVAGVGVADLDAGAEPGGALLRRPVREGVGVHVHAGFLHQDVVADLRGGVQPLLDVAGLQDPRGLRRASPHAG